jgi:hypothetical protein
MNVRSILIAASVAVVFAGCKKEFDSPPLRTIPVGEVLTIAQLKALYTTQRVRFAGTEKSVYAVVTSDENDGNFYKNITVQDATGGITLRLLNSGGLYVGDSVRIYLPGTVLAPYNGLMQLDSVDVDNNIIKQATLVQVTPRVATIPEIEANVVAWQSTLVKLENVEFTVEDAVNGTWADAVNQQTGERFLSDCDGNTIMVRTSGYSSYAGQPLPQGNGSIVCVVGLFGSTIQLGNRSLPEVQLNDPDRCDPLPTLCPAVASVQQDFSTTVSNVDIGNLTCWNNTPQAGSRLWRGRDVSGNLCASASAVSSSSSSDVMWLITPPVTVTPSTTLSFRSQRQFDAPGHVAPLAVFISTNYAVTNLASATWIPVPAPIASELSADGAWIASGEVGIASLLPVGYSGGFVVGFKYSGSGPNGQTMRINIDDVVIQ